MEYSFGIDIGGTTAKMGLFQLRQSLVHDEKYPREDECILLEQRNIETEGITDPDEFFPHMGLSMHVMLKSHGLSPENLAGIGVGVPGAVKDHRTVNRCVNMGWDVTDIAGRFQMITGLSNIRVENDSNLAALGEMWQGGGKGYSSEVMVTIGTGIGAGIVYDGELITGANGAAGEIGHMKMMDAGGEMCSCGGTGCLEQRAAAAGIVKRTLALLKEYPQYSTILRRMAYDRLTAKDVFDAARDGDQLALQVRRETGHLIGKALSYVSCVYDPEVFVIGGGISQAGEPFLKDIERSYRENAFHASRDTQFKLAELGPAAGIYGAAKIVL